MDSSATSTSDGSRGNVALRWVILGTVLFALPSLNDGLISDDYELIEESRLTHWGDVVRAVAEPGMNGFYRPLPRLLLGINWALHGLHPVGYHLLNILLHLGSTLALFAMLSAILWDRRVSGVAALCFGCHFVHVEPVYWVSARNELLAAFFYLLTLWWAMCAEHRPTARMLVAGTLALLSKETAVTLPLAIAAMGMITATGTPLIRLRAGLLRSLPLVCLVMLYGVVRVLTGAAWPGTRSNVVFSLNPVILVRNLEQYALQLLIPVRTLLDVSSPATYGVVTKTLHAGLLSPVMIALLCGGGLLLWFAGKIVLVSGGRPARLGLLFAGIAALPYLLMDGTGQRYLYLPSAGVALALAATLVGLTDRFVIANRRGYALYGGATALCAASLLVTVEQARWWERAGDACERVVQTVTRFTVAHPSDAPLYVLNIPHRLHGAYVFQNGFPHAMRLHGVTRPILDGDRVLERMGRLPADADVYRYE